MRYGGCKFISNELQQKLFLEISHNQVAVICCSFAFLKHTFFAMEQPEVKPAPAESNQPKKQQERKGKNKKEDGDEKKGKGTLKTPKVFTCTLSFIYSTLCDRFADIFYKQGTKDYEPSEMVIREEVMRIIVSVFKKHGAVTIETPLFELKVLVDIFCE
jgi:hypothetical protein